MATAPEPEQTFAPTDFDLAELTTLAMRAKMTMRMYMLGRPHATPQELDTLVAKTVGRGQRVEMVLAAQIVASTQMAMEDLGLKVPPNDLVLTEAILDTVWADRDNHAPDSRTIARRAWVLAMTYRRRDRRGS